ncbi:3'-5' exonuclease family protein [Roseomonas populi]|uniref:Transcriptional regulator n=1 Tax=Roseomonas populi TaxID=3121582 RepID=A0ABT1XB96_9PROT|nr:transcriptional regulator [Roseomonas pecuniae]MCR0985021.1 transcriptional regulator [Roseomonas pecuniae]
MIIFLDFEASSLAVASFPVEAGWVTEDGEGEAHLIRPAPGWDDWSAEAERMHGLSREHLAREGKSVEEVARRILDVLGTEGVTVATDAARWEQMWLNRLMQAAGLMHSIKVLELEREVLLPEAQRILHLAPAEGTRGAHLARGALLDRASEIVGDSQHAEKELRRVRHRALQDAEGMRWWWLEVRERVAEALGEEYGSRLLARKGSVPPGILGWD